MAWDGERASTVPPIIAAVPSFDGSAQTWIIVAILAGIIEVSIPHFGVVFVSVAAVAAAVAAALGAGFVAQLVTFVVVLAGSLALLRPWFIARMGKAPGVPSRTEALVGHAGVVTLDIDPLVGSGRVNIGGADWAAHSAGPLPAGTPVRVIGADGIVLEVAPQ
jgi:membrane protein implicated in regulation of membrane protease activity